MCKIFLNYIFNYTVMNNSNIILGKGLKMG